MGFSHVTISHTGTDNSTIAKRQLVPRQVANSPHFQIRHIIAKSQHDYHLPYVECYLFVVGTAYKQQGPLRQIQPQWEGGYPITHAPPPYDLQPLNPLLTARTLVNLGICELRNAGNVHCLANSVNINSFVNCNSECIVKV